MTDEKQSESRRPWIFNAGVLLAAAALTLPWSMVLEYLKKDNPDLSTSFVVQLLPLWLAVFLLGLRKNKRSKS